MKYTSHGHVSLAAFVDNHLEGLDRQMNDSD